jgi:prolyl-tRNA synthetase
VSPLALNTETFPRVTTVVDASLVTAKVPLAVRALSTSQTVFLSGPDLLTYLRNLETTDAKVHEVDFVALKSETADGPAAQPKPAEKKEKKAEREDAKIEGAVQIAIGVKKEIDFAAWYTNVGICASGWCLMLNGHSIQVLVKADMLDYYNVSGCYVLKPWSYSIWEIIQGK